MITVFVIAEIYYFFDDVGFADDIKVTAVNLGNVTAALAERETFS
jgi:hypothetical protein